MPDLAHDHAADIEPHADLQRLVEFVAKLCVQGVERKIDQPCRPQGLYAPRVRSFGMTEHRHQPVAGIFFDPAAVRDHRVADAVEELIEDVDHVIGQLVCAELGEPAKIEEQDRRGGLHALRVDRGCRLQGLQASFPG